jgi:hypothetical protein
VEAVTRCKRLVTDEQHQRRMAVDHAMVTLGGKVDAEERARMASVAALKVVLTQHGMSVDPAAVTPGSKEARGTMAAVWDARLSAEHGSHHKAVVRVQVRERVGSAREGEGVAIERARESGGRESRKGAGHAAFRST